MFWDIFTHTRSWFWDSSRNNKTFKTILQVTCSQAGTLARHHQRKHSTNPAQHECHVCGKCVGVTHCKAGSSGALWGLRVHKQGLWRDIISVITRLILLSMTAMFVVSVGVTHCKAGSSGALWGLHVLKQRLCRLWKNRFVFEESVLFYFVCLAIA